MISVKSLSGKTWEYEDPEMTVGKLFYQVAADCGEPVARVDLVCQAQPLYKHGLSAKLIDVCSNMDVYLVIRQISNQAHIRKIKKRIANVIAGGVHAYMAGIDIADIDTEIKRLHELYTQVISISDDAGKILVNLML